MNTHIYRRFVRLFGPLVLFALLLAACGTPDSPSAGTGGTAAAPAASGAAATAAPAASVAAAAPVASDSKDPNDCQNVQSDLKIGFDTSLTGGTADLGEGHRKGFKLALKEYNAKGGYQGKTKVGCVILDDSTKPAQGLANTTRLTNQDKAIGLIAFTNTGVAVPATKQLNDGKIPVIVPVATGTKVTSQFTAPGSFVFRMSMADINQVQVIMAQIEKLGVTKPAIMHDTTGYGTLGRDDLTTILATKNLKPVSVGSFQYGETDMTGQLNAAKNAGADSILTYALAPELANLLKSMDKLGWYPPVVGSWTLAQPDMVKFAGPDIVKKFKIYMVQSFTVDRDETAKAFHAKIEAEYGAGQDRVPITAAQGYDAANLFLAALDKVGTDPLKLRDAIEATDNFKGVTTAPTKPYGPNDHEAIEVKDMFVATWQDVGGTLQVVKAQ